MSNQSEQHFKSKSKNIPADLNPRDLIPEHLRDDPNVVIDDPKTIEIALIREANDRENQRLRRLEAQEQERQQALIRQREKQDVERRECERKLGKTLPERLLQKLLTGKRDTCSICHHVQQGEFYGHGPQCPIRTGSDIEPGLRLLAQEYSNGTLIKRLVGQRAYDRLVEFALPDETWDSLMNRLLDVATAEAFSA